MMRILIQTENPNLSIKANYKSMIDEFNLQDVTKNYFRIEVFEYYTRSIDILHKLIGFIYDKFHRVCIIEQNFEEDGEPALWLTIKDDIGFA